MYNVAELSSNRTGGNGFQVETENAKIIAHVLQKASNLVISHCCLAELSEEMYQNLKHTCSDLVFLIKPYCFVTLLLPSP